MGVVLRFFTRLGLTASPLNELPLPRLPRNPIPNIIAIPTRFILLCFQVIQGTKELCELTDLNLIERGSLAVGGSFGGSLVDSEDFIASRGTSGVVFSSGVLVERTQVVYVDRPIIRARHQKLIIAHLSTNRIADILLTVVLFLL